MPILGCHVGFKKDTQLLGSLQEALNYKADTFMFYTGAPQNTKRNNIEDGLTLQALNIMKENNIDYSKVVVHAPYIINLCNENNFSFSVSFLTEEMNRCNLLGVKYMVLHPGSHVGIGEEAGLNNIIKGLNLVFENLKDNNNVTILLETMAGKGTELGTTTEQIKYIIDNINDKDHIGVCLDTCHLNDAGYDLNNFDDYLDSFDKLIGIEKIGCIHVNDSKNVISSHKDRHENIGFGTIGFDTLINIIYNKRLENIPKILETPFIDKKYPPYKYEIEMIRKKEFNKDLIETIKKQD